MHFHIDSVGSIWNFHNSFLANTARFRRHDLPESGIRIRFPFPEPRVSQPLYQESMCSTKAPGAPGAFTFCAGCGVKSTAEVGAHSAGWGRVWGRGRARAAAQTLSGPPGALRGPFFARPRPARPPAGSPGLAPLRGPAAAARRAPGGRGQAVRAGVRAMRGQEIPDRRPRPSAVRHPPRARALHRSRVGQDRAPCACAEIGEHLQNLTDNTCISERRIMTQTMAHLLLLVVSSYSAGLVRYRRFGRPCHVLTLCCTFRRV